MRIGYVYYFENPEMRGHLRRINEARSAAIYGAVRWLAERVAALAGRLAQGFVTGYREQATVRALSRLDDAILRDIGLTRGEIEGVAREAVRRPPEAAERRRADLPAARPAPAAAEPEPLRLAA